MSGAITAESLRRAFDERFAEPAAARAPEGERLLLVDLGGARVALRVGELSGLHPVGKIVRLPGGSADLVGITGIRGRVVPVFDLAALLGAPPAARPRRFIALAGAGERVGLLVAEIEGWVEIGRAEIRAAAGDAGGHHVPELACVSGALLPVPSIPSLLREIAARAHQGGAAR
ncbi:MAG: chemotaxis protein CheW [Minicystis sp.]